MPVAARGAAEASTSRSGTSFAAPARGIRGEQIAAALAAPGSPTGSSTRVFQPPHAGQRPSQRGCCAPHSLQTKTLRARAIVR